MASLLKCCYDQIRIFSFVAVLNQLSLNLFINVFIGCHLALRLVNISVFISDVHLDDPVVTTEDAYNSSSSSLKTDILLSDHVVNKCQIGNLSGPSSLYGQAIKSGFIEESQVQSDSRCHNTETDDEQNIEKKTAGNGR